MPSVVNASPLIFSPFSSHFFFCAIADPSQCERKTSFSGLVELLSAYLRPRKIFGECDFVVFSRNIWRTLINDNFTKNPWFRKEKSLSVYFIANFIVIQSKTFISFELALPKSISDKTASINYWALAKIVSKTTLRHKFSSINLQYLPLGGPRNLCA